ncbi:MAG: hypothetical protein GQ549_05165 [Gammaproteobacteria bacterium]|nr:hypothetical protein [Gammaproteobacteria bacterium]
MARKQQQPWQFKLTMALSMLMLFLVFGYFYQSFVEIRKVKPVSVAIERLTESSTELNANPDKPQTKEPEKKGTVDP